MVAPRRHCIPGFVDLLTSHFSILVRNHFLKHNFVRLLYQQRHALLANAWQERPLLIVSQQLRLLEYKQGEHDCLLPHRMGHYPF